MNEVMLDDIAIKLKVKKVTAQINKLTKNYSLDDYGALVKLAKKIKRDFGGELMPADEPKANRVGFLWSRVYGNLPGQEAVCHVVIDCKKCSEKELKKHIKYILSL